MDFQETVHIPANFDGFGSVSAASAKQSIVYPASEHGAGAAKIPHKRVSKIQRSANRPNAA